MDPQQFDALTRRLTSGGSRRRVLTALVGGAFGRALGLPSANRVAASEECDNPCPPEKPCCIKGKCREKCGDTCCADCFTEVLLINEQPHLGPPICCKSTDGTICEHKKPGKADDRCCYPNEICVKGKCCCHAMGAGCLGAIKCGGKCCAKEACCNGKCCEKGYVCARKNEGDPRTCVRANRECNITDECFHSETCHGDICCSGLRVCGDGNGNPVCCKAGEYCEFQQDPQIAECCPINTICKGTYRGHRVRR